MQLVDDLFDRLAKLENVPRDPDAERLIANGLRRAPHAVYALVQTTLLQDEALKRANARIEELQAQTSGAAEPEQRPASFLDSMREALGGRAPRGSVPSVRTAGGYQSQNFQQQGSQPQAGYPPQMPLSGYPGAPGFGSGGSFLGTAASAAAGVIGGHCCSTASAPCSAITPAWPVRARSASATISGHSRTGYKTANRIWRTRTGNKMPNKIWPTTTPNKTPNKI